MIQVEEKAYKVYLGGKWIATNEEIQVTNPATGKPFARVCAVTRDQVREAFENAQAAFPAWRGITAKERGTLLLRIAGEVEKRQDEIAQTITLENGKPFVHAHCIVGFGDGSTKGGHLVEGHVSLSMQVMVVDASDAAESAQK